MHKPYSMVISPDDHMLTADKSAYFRVTESSLINIRDALCAIGVANADVGSVLDFGCGYGRAYRALSYLMPNANLTACDLIADAAQYCANTFGGDWVEAHEDVSRIAFPRKYDVIWLGSVFTHLPEHRWALLLDALSATLNPGGVIVMTMHGARSIFVIETVLLERNPHAIDGNWFADMKKNLPETGFAFAPNKPAAIRHQNNMGMDVTQGEYGFSFNTPGWFADYIGKRSDLEMVDFVPAGWDNNHDVGVVSKIAD